ncbi:HEAT repeat domain-containing protein [Brasilonema sp. CT11]|nr:HEAT repeat domain-containing protein [Brasilonema sp. CT11]
MVDWKPYLQSICATYDQLWEVYTLTDVVGKKHHSQVRKSLLLDLQAIAVKPEAIKPEAVKPEAVKPENELLSEASEKREILNVLEGLRKYASEHVLLIGRPGSGKSTALKRLLLEQAVAISTTGGKTQIPVLVELRYYQTSIIDLIKDFLHRHHPSLPIDGGEKIKELLRQGQFLLLLDGVNELPSPEARRNLQKFRQDFHKTTPMIFTTRDLGVGGDLEISKKLEMQPLTETQMRDFVRGYLPEVGEQMLKQLGDRLRKFGETPLLLMMLCSVFASNQNKLPPNLGSVFRRFTEIYDDQLKQDVPISQESRRWRKRLLQHLAWVMMGGNPDCRDVTCNVSTSTEFLVAIPRQQAEEIFTEFLEGKVACAADNAIAWLDDLLKHHLIQLGAENKIEFRHQLIQEYYAAERFLQEVKNLSDDELQWDYLNDLKWTEPVVLMIELVEDEALALRVVKLALQVDWQLGARLAGAVKSQWQEKTVGLISHLGLPRLLEIRLLGITKSEAAIPGLIKLLEHQDSEVRRDAASALRKIGSSQAIPGLIKLLEHQNSSVRRSAASALEKIGSSQAIPGLIKLLEHQDSEVRRIAASALGEIGSSQAIPGLIKLLGHQDSEVRRIAASALGEIGSSQAIPGLIKLLGHQDSSVRRNAASALGKIGSSQAIPGLIKLLGHQDSEVRRSSAYALGKIGSSQAIPGLIKLLEYQDSSVRWTAASALGEIGSSQAIPGLIKLLEDRNSFVRRTAAYTLEKIDSSQAIPGLIKLLEDQNSEVRRTAAYALGKIGSSQAIPGLIKLLEHQDSEVRRIAASALGKIGSSQAIPGLIKLLEHQDSFVRRIAAYALGKLDSSHAISELIKLLEHQDSSIRLSAAKALGKLDLLHAISELIKLLEHQDSSIRLSAAKALGKLDSSHAIPGLIKLLEDQDSSVRLSAASALGEIGSSQAIPGLIKLLEDQDSSVRLSAAYALGQIGSSQAVPQLIQSLSIETFVAANEGDNLSGAIQALETIQQHCKRYKPTPIRTMSNPLSHNYALLIGVGECEEPKLSLPVTVKDIQTLKSLLIDQNLCGYIDNDQHLRLLHDETATTQNILDSLNWLKQQAENDPEATIFIYYSGHGCLDESGDYYLIPHETDRVDIPNTALSAAKFNAALQQIPAKQLLVIIDSCHAQGMAASKDNAGKNNRSTLPKGFTQTALPKNIINELKQGTGRVVFTSSTGNQSSYIRPDGKMSVYTYHFLEALQGAANQPGDKVVRVSHLMNYLGKTVPESAQQLCKAEQTPFFDFATEDFPVVSLRGGKGLPQEGWDNVKTEAQENIRSISNQVNNGVGIVGDRNVGFNIGTAGNITFGDISSG